MRIFIKVKASAGEEKVEKIGDNRFAVFVKEPTEKNRANKAVIKVIAKHLGISKNRVSIISGLVSKNKVIEILE